METNRLATHQTQASGFAVSNRYLVENLPNYPTGGSISLSLSTFVLFQEFNYNLSKPYTLLRLNLASFILLRKVF